MKKKIFIGTLCLRQVDLLAGLSYEELLNLLFPEGNYVALVRWMETPAGKAAIGGYHQMSWAERATALMEIVPWSVDRNQLRKATNRLTQARNRALKYKKAQMGAI